MLKVSLNITFADPDASNHMVVGCERLWEGSIPGMPQERVNAIATDLVTFISAAAAVWLDKNMLDVDQAPRLRRLN